MTSLVGLLTTHFLDMPVCNIGIAAKLFECTNASLGERSTPWANVVAFELDTTNVMVGKHHSVLSRVKEKQPHCVQPRLCMSPCQSSSVGRG